MTSFCSPRSLSHVAVCTVLALVTPACSADRTVSDAGPDDGGAADSSQPPLDAGADAEPLDGSTDLAQGDQGEDELDLGGPPDAGTPVPGWSEGADLFPGPVATRVTSSVFADGRAVVMFETATTSNVLRALSWHGGETGAWTDLGVVNAGVAGTLAPLNNLDDLHLRIVHVGEDELLAVFQQDGGLYSNYFDGDVWGTPLRFEDSLSTITLSSDGGARAVLVYGLGTQVTARFYDSSTHTLGAAVVVADLGLDLQLPLNFLSRAEIGADGAATVFFRDRDPATPSVYTVRGYRRAAGSSTFTSELTPLTNLNSPFRFCSAGNAAGDVVFSFDERFTNMFGTFDRVRHVYRDAETGFTAVSDTSASGLLPNIDSCAISSNGDALIMVVNSNLPSAVFVPIQYLDGVASTGGALTVPVSVTGSRPQGSMATGGLGAVSYFRNDERVEVAQQATRGGEFATGDFLSLPNVINTQLDQLWKASQRMDDGRYVLLYQSGANHLRYAVLD